MTKKSENTKVSSLKARKLSTDELTKVTGGCEGPFPKVMLCENPEDCN